MTVSKALRDEPDVSAATNAQIKQLALQTGYVPDSSAQGLRTKTTKLFGLVIPATTNPIYARIVYAIEERAHDLGYDILLAHTHNQPEREETCLAACCPAGWTACSSRRSIGSRPRRGSIRKLCAQNPTVLLGPPAPFCK